MASQSANTPTTAHRALADKILRMGRGAGESPLTGPVPSPDEITAIVNDLLSVVLPGTRRTRLTDNYYSVPAGRRVGGG